MLTNQMIGAAHNAATHTPRVSQAQDTRQDFAVKPEQPVAPNSPQATDQISARAVQPAQEAEEAQLQTPKMLELELPERAEMSIAVVDTVPDVEPESLYRARVSEESAA